MEDMLSVVIQPISPVELVNKKLLVHKDWTFGKFMFLIRKNIKISSECAIFLTVSYKNREYHISNSDLMSTIHHSYKNDDDCLIVIARSENTFG
jgi:GABA(A) receptor-associated protein